MSEHTEHNNNNNNTCKRAGMQGSESHIRVV